MSNLFRVAFHLPLVLTFATPIFAASERLRVVIAGVELPSERTRSIVVESTATGVDGAIIVIEGTRTLPSVGDSLGVETAVDRRTNTSNAIFKGEIVSIEPVFDAAESRVIIRGLNRLHRLNRAPRSRTFENQSDADVAATIAREAGLSFGPTGPEAAARRDSIVQQDQTDLDFLRARAARIGYEILVDDTTLYFRRRPDFVPVPLTCDTETNAGARVRIFHPRTASAGVVKQVMVRGWDAVRSEEIVAEATRPMIPLSPAANSIEIPPGPSLDLGFVPAIPTIESAYGAAQGTLVTLTALDLAAEADTDGDVGLTAGAVISIDQLGSRFNGKYLVNGASHRFDRDSPQGWHTLLRLVRVDRAVFVLPEVGDEVLVAFESGAPHRPFVVGSIWDSQEPVDEAPFCRPRSSRED